MPIRTEARAKHGHSLEFKDTMKLFAGNSNPALAHEVAGYLDLPLGRAEVATFSDGECCVELGENVRGMDTFVLQSICAPATSLAVIGTLGFTFRSCRA